MNIFQKLRQLPSNPFIMKMRLGLRAKMLFNTLLKRKNSNELIQEYDKIDFGYTMIYRCSYITYLIYLQAANFICAGIGIFGINEVINKRKPLSLKKPSSYFTQLDLNAMIVAGICMFTIQFRHGLRHPLRIYLNPYSYDYIAVFYDVIPYTKKYVKFTPNTIKKVDPKRYSMIIWKTKCYLLNQSKYMFIFEDNFFKPIHYNVMLGYTNYKKTC